MHIFGPKIGQCAKARWNEMTFFHENFFLGHVKWIADKWNIICYNCRNISIFKLCITVPTLGELGYNISIVHVDQSVLSDAVSHSSEIRFLCLMKWSC